MSKKKNYKNTRKNDRKKQTHSIACWDRSHSNRDVDEDRVVVPGTEGNVEELGYATTCVRYTLLLQRTCRDTHMCCYTCFTAK